MTQQLIVPDRFDVIIIGGGINGTSAAHHLAADGYKVLLAERADFASGATGRSSRILHCGLRYFETPNPIRTFLRSPKRLVGAARMAMAAMRAREELVRLQPALCKPFTMCFPLFEGGGFRGWHLDAGFQLLKRLGPSSLPLDYKRITVDFATHLPFAGDLRDQDRLSSVCTYREYMIDWPDRICVDTALAAEKSGATIHLFTEAALLERNNKGEWLVELSRDDHKNVVCAAIVLNIAGTWIDQVLAPVSTHTEPLVRGTKGAHIIVSLPERYQGFGITTLGRNGLPFYCLPHRDRQFVFGPTETAYDGDAKDAHPTEDDIESLLAEANYLLPGLDLTRSSVEFSWAGVRPLTFDAALPMGRRTRQIHDLTENGMPGIFALTAGPVMTFKSAGRELADAVSRKLQPTRPPKIDSSISSERSDCVLHVGSNSTTAMFRAAVVAEHAADLPGILYTRTGIAWGRHLDRREVEAAAASVADLLGWSPQHVSQRVDQFMEHQSRTFPA